MIKIFLLAVGMLFLAADGRALTRNFVPRTTGEGNIGLSTKPWSGVFTASLTASGATSLQTVNTAGLTASSGTFSGGVKSGNASYEKLIGNGSIQIYEASYPNVRFNNTTIPVSGSNGFAIGIDGAGAGYVGRNDAGAINLYTNNVVRQTIAGDGAVTIPGSAFSVGGSTLVVANGFVGIGRTPTAGKLDIYQAGDGPTIHMLGDASREVYLSLNNAANDISENTSINSFVIRNVVADLAFANRNSTGKIAFLTGASTTEKMTILTGGNVGIGTTAPGRALEVTGTGIRISTAATSGDFMCIAGAFTTLPTTGYQRGCFAYLTTDPTNIYISTETVVGTYSWRAK